MLRKIFHTFISRGLNAGLNLLLVLLTARYLGAGVRGEISLLVASMNISLHAVGLAGGATLLYLVPRFSPQKLYRISLLWLCLITLLSYPVLKLLDQTQGLEAVWWILLLLLFNWSNLNRYMLLAFRKIELDNQIGVGFGIVQLVLLAALLFGGVERNLFLFIGMLLAANLILLLGTTFLLLRHWPKDGAARTEGIGRAMFGHGGWAQIANIAQFFSYRLSYYLVEDHLGTAALGVYGVAVSLAEALWIISRSISLVQLSEIANTNDEAEQYRLTALWSRATIWLTAFVLAPLLLIPDAAFSWLFGEEFQNIAKLLFWLAPGILAFAATNIITHFFGGKGQYQINALVSFVTLLLVALTVPTFTRQYGLIGAAAAQSLAYIGAWVLSAALFGRLHWKRWAQLVPHGNDLKILRKKWLLFREKA